MAPLPKKRISSARRGKRREKIKFNMANLAVCPNCKKKVTPHTVCKNGGTYKKRVVKPPKVKTKVRRSENK
jgi:large subunit ribosomal protein L32